MKWQVINTTKEIKYNVNTNIKTKHTPTCMMHQKRRIHVDWAFQMELPYIAPSYGYCTNEEAL
jgi:hypothetical protein